MINALLNNTMARQALRHIDLTSKYLGRYSGLAQETNCNLELLVKSFIDYVGTIFLISKCSQKNSRKNWSIALPQVKR
jgi:hypothetical protein